MTTNAKVIWTRIQWIEHALKHNKTDDDMEWATNPYAIEYRDLLKQWWALPSIPSDVMKEIGQANRPMMTMKGKMLTCQQRWGLRVRLTKRRKLILRLSGKPLPEKRKRS